MQVDGLPRITCIAVIGGQSIAPRAAKMACLIGYHIIDAGCCLVTGGRKGAGESASRGAYEACLQKGLNPMEFIFSLVPEGEQPDFQIGSCIHVGKNKLERRIALVQNTFGAVIIGGGKGTASEIRLAVLQAIMDGYKLIPASGTGGEADRICSAIPPFEDDILNNPYPSDEKARRLVERMLRTGPCWYCDIDPSKAHDEWFFSSKRNRIADEMYRIRHKYF